MAGVTNTTARQYNLKVVREDGARVTLRLVPGFNSVDDAIWACFAKAKKVDPYVAQLKKSGVLKFGKSEDDKELDEESLAKTVSKVSAPPQTTSNGDSEDDQTG